MTKSYKGRMQSRNFIPLDWKLNRREWHLSRANTVRRLCHDISRYPQLWGTVEVCFEVLKIFLTTTNIEIQFLDWTEYVKLGKWKKCIMNILLPFLQIKLFIIFLFDLFCWEFSVWTLSPVWTSATKNPLQVLSKPLMSWIRFGGTRLPSESYF